MMKQIMSLLGGIVLVLASVLLQSCSDEYDPGIFTQHEVKQLDYNEAFNDYFGKVEPNHEWGFKPQPVITINAPSTRVTNTEMNQWVSLYHLDVPGGLYTDAEHNRYGVWTKGDVTDPEREYVYWWFSTHKNPEPLTINWSDYFIQNVWGQPEHSTQGNYGMDQCTPIFPNGTKDDHVSNFNSGGHAAEQIEYQWKSTTNAFGYISSYSTGASEDKFMTGYTLQYINGNYYLAYDYEYHKPNENNHLERDGYYNDWILKLWGGYHQADEYSQRIMCEDLGGSFDFDFNDVVFDVTFIQDYSTNQTKADITLQAAGGTLPMYIGEVKEEYEVHNLFGVDTTTPVNVSVNGVSRPAVKFTIALNDKNYDSSYEDVTINYQRYKNPKGIKIFVKDASGIAHEICQFAEKNNPTHSNQPDKICCPTTTNWMQELQHISDGYPLFKSWVSDSSIEWYNTKGLYLYPNNGVGQTSARPYSPSTFVDEHNGYTGFTPWEVLVQNEVNWSMLQGSNEQKAFQSQCPSENGYKADHLR
ncbi:MAG: hypothetical protein MJZ69_00650 [Bacteroidaceae bacterium]|nr:hypothetical protein [Bacteroidaceae bacterium]